MEYYNKVLCVGYGELTSGIDPVVSSSALDKMLQRRSVRKENQAAPGRQVLVAYSSLPTRIKTRWEARYGNPEKKMREEMNRDRVKRDPEAIAWFADFRYEMNGEEVSLPDKAQEELVVNASVLNALIAQENTMRASAGKLCCRGGDTKEAAVRLATELQEYCSHTLPLSVNRLSALMKRYRKEHYAALISGKYGNVNSRKLSMAAQQWLIAAKRCRKPVMTDAQILTAYNEIAHEKGWKQLRSINTLVSWLKSPAIEPLWYDAVYGELKSAQRYTHQHTTALPTRRDTLWYGDGTKVNLYYRDECGKVRTINVYEVIDAYSEAMLGFHISASEDFEAQYGAYRMAIQVSGHKPFELVHDNQGGHKKLNGLGGGFLDNICRVHRATKPYNGQSKTIESVFGRFQSQVLHKFWAFTGMNVTTKSAKSKPNLEFVDANKDKLPTLMELKAIYAEAREEWNSMAHPATGVARMAMYEESENPETEVMTPQEMVRAFWLLTEKPATYTAGGLKVTIKGREYEYDVFERPGVVDHKWHRRNVGAKFRVQYDPYDMGSIRLYKEDAGGELRFVRVAETKIVIHRALQDQTEGEMAFIRQEQQANLQDRIDRQIEAKEIEKAHGVMPEQLGLRTPKLKGITAEAQRQIDRRTALYQMPPVETQAGRVTKELSNLTWDELTQPREFDAAAVIGQL